MRLKHFLISLLIILNWRETDYSFAADKFSEYAARNYDNEWTIVYINYVQVDSCKIVGYKRHWKNFAWIE